MRGWPLLLLLALAAPSYAADCREETFLGEGFVICDIHASQDDLRVFLKDKDGDVFGRFSRLDAALNEEGARLGFATNAGMYHDDRRPVGYYVENGKELQAVISTDGPGNFGLLPNGIFCVREDDFAVIETQLFLANPPECVFATQSGPMLVIEGDLHPRFLPDGSSTYVRNGVGVSEDGEIASFAISKNAVNFHTFGRLFRDHLSLKNALYLDGNISRMRVPELGLDGAGFVALGPILGVVEPLE
ncbi:MAG: phosphodiester glycosidase family protein [Pseudomonadota bacterium]